MFRAKSYVSSCVRGSPSVSAPRRRPFALALGYEAHAIASRARAEHEKAKNDKRECNQYRATKANAARDKAAASPFPRRLRPRGSCTRSLGSPTADRCREARPGSSRRHSRDRREPCHRFQSIDISPTRAKSPKSARTAVECARHRPLHIEIVLAEPATSRCCN